MLDYAFDSNRDNIQTNEHDDNLVVDFGAGNGTYPTGLVLIPSPSSATPRSVRNTATGDFNGDGIPDLIVTDFAVASSPVLYLFTGKGDGSFNTPITNSQMIGITSMVIKDFNRDGFADMAVTATGQNAVLVLMGKGDGTFLPPVSYPTGNTPTLATALQSRGIGVDLAVLNRADHTLGILLGDGDGTFLAQRTYSLMVPNTSVESQIVVADVTGDGLQDIVVRNTNFSVQFTCTGLPANSTCSFAPATLAATGAPLSTTLTIATSVAAAGLQPPVAVPDRAAISFACLLGLLSFTTLRSARRRKDIHRLNFTILAAACLFAATLITGCSNGSNGSRTSPTPPVYQTPIGTSAVTITALTSGTNIISKVSQLTVTVTQ